jgi:hypothetical protein
VTSRYTTCWSCGKFPLRSPVVKPSPRAAARSTRRTPHNKHCRAYVLHTDIQRRYGLRRIANQPLVDSGCRSTKCPVSLSRPRGTQPMHDISIRGDVVGIVDEFVYLGSMLSSDGSLDKEVNRRIASAAKAFHLLLRCFRCKSITRHTKVAVYKACVVPCLLYGCETWPILDRHLKRLHVFHMNSLRRICNLSRRRRISNHAILELCEIDDVEMLLHRNRLRWLGHVARMDEQRVPKKLLFSGVSGCRSRGRPKKRWTDVVKVDLKRKGHTNNWFRSCQNRASWRSMLYEGRN